MRKGNSKEDLLLKEVENQTSSTPTPTATMTVGWTPIPTANVPDVSQMAQL
ncbi:hypothetical protein [Duncaniella muris]|jgi:hypothetical protein|uniref:hypothetical protein n=1 Tax=Duncaniella muris TaxID=2094150 RepID=UPI003F66D9AA